MTSLTFLLDWQCCSKSEVVSLGALSSSVLCAVLNYLKEKITVSFIKWERVLKNLTLYAAQDEVKQLSGPNVRGLVAC